ncbi:MAG TPA: glycoside hydrolase family 15 protein [Roseococcus sp.]|jgi:GH15 family glucan-1,4-alpha-glucosidase|nr:glycoside hydrolase family 15 protein [Roseococcus sp.]
MPRHPEVVGPPDRPPQPLDLAATGNGTVAALISPAGAVNWMCWPRLDGDPVFSALVDGDQSERGFTDILMTRFAHSRQRYRRNSAVLETELTDSQGNALLITDHMPRLRRFGRMFRPPMLVRRIELLRGRPRIRLRVRPCFGWGQESPRGRAGSNHISYVGGGEAMRLSTDAPLGFILSETEFALDRPLSMMFGPDETVNGMVSRVAKEFEDETQAYWEDWVRGLSLPFEWQDEVIRAAITLKLCAHDDTGGILAALTTSIPEAEHTQRNWDYRFCWLRDAYFTVMALNRLGATRTMEHYIGYITNAVLEQTGMLRPVYPLVPNDSIDEWEATALKGFMGHAPVRVGNAAALQVQNDVWGAVVMAAAMLFFDHRLPEPAGEALYRRLVPLGVAAEAAALTADAGIWEYRGRERIHTFSAAMCWAAVDRLGRIAAHLGLVEEAADWQARAATLKEAILEGAWNEEAGSLQEVFGGHGLDAALLLLPEIGLLPPTDPRFVATVEAIERDLMRDGMLLRYSAADDFGVPETAFIVCSFWLVDALAAIGRKSDARSLFERILSLRNHVGLLPEDVDPRTGQLWGNFPQSYSQVGLVLSAMRLSRSWEEGFWRAW